MGNSNPSAKTLISIRTQYNVNLNWLLTGVNEEDGITLEDDYEKTLIEVFRNLNDYDKNEIIEIIRLKTRLKLTQTSMLLKRYNKMKTSAGYLRSYGVNRTISRDKPFVYRTFSNGQ